MGSLHKAFPETRTTGGCFKDRWLYSEHALSKARGLHHRPALLLFKEWLRDKTTIINIQYLTWKWVNGTSHLQRNKWLHLLPKHVQNWDFKLQDAGTLSLPWEGGSFPPATGFPDEMAGNSSLPCLCMRHRVLIALIKHCDQNQPGEERVYVTL